MQSESSSSSTTTTSNTRAAQSVIDRILCDFTAIPNNLFSAIDSDDSERLRLVLEETISQLTNQPADDETTVRRRTRTPIRHFVRLVFSADAGHFGSGDGESVSARREQLDAASSVVVLRRMFH